MSYTHTKECDTAGMAQDAARERWKAAWPDYCSVCEGRGGTHYAGYFDYKAGAGEPPSFDPCEACVCQGRCARCQSALSDQETGEGPCTACGWNYDDELPEPYDCDCWLSAEQVNER
jgi:hypothetical protein